MHHIHHSYASCAMNPPAPRTHCAPRLYCDVQRSTEPRWQGRVLRPGPRRQRSNPRAAAARRGEPGPGGGCRQRRAAGPVGADPGKANKPPVPADRARLTCFGTRFLTCFDARFLTCLGARFLTCLFRFALFFTCFNTRFLACSIRAF